MRARSASWCTCGNAASVTTSSAAAASRFGNARSGRRSAQVAFGGWENFDTERALALKNAVDRNRNLPKLLLTWRFGTFRRRLGRLRRALRRDLRRRRTGVRGPGRRRFEQARVPGLCLRRASRSRIRIVHVVRDSPAVVYSWSKVVARPEALDDIMAQYSPLRAAMWWNVYNLMFTADPAHPHPDAPGPVRGLHGAHRWPRCGGSPPGRARTPTRADYLTDDTIQLGHRPHRRGQSHALPAG